VAGCALTSWCTTFFKVALGSVAERGRIALWDLTCNTEHGLANHFFALSHGITTLRCFAVISRASTGKALGFQNKSGLNGTMVGSACTHTALFLGAVSSFAYMVAAQIWVQHERQRSFSPHLDAELCCAERIAAFVTSAKFSFALVRYVFLFLQSKAMLCQTHVRFALARTAFSFMTASSSTWVQDIFQF